MYFILITNKFNTVIGQIKIKALLAMQLKDKIGSCEHSAKK
jgi:hypothetical protein